MSSIKKILVALDDHSNERLVIQKGLSLAKEHHAQIMVLTVLNQTDKMAHTFSDVISEEKFLAYVFDHQRERIEEIIQEYNTHNIKISCEFDTGDPYLKIIQRAFDFSADIILHSSHSEQQERLFFSSADWRLIRKSPVPVWIVKNEEPDIPKKMMVAIDVTQDSGDMDFNKIILNLAAQIARASNAQLDVVSVWEVFGEQSARYSPLLNVSKQQIEDIIEKTASEIQTRQNELKNWLSDTHPDCTALIKWVIEKGEASELISRYAHDQDIGLLIIGTVNRTGIAGLFIGNTAETVLSKVKCSVLTIKPPLFESPVKKTTSD